MKINKTASIDISSIGTINDARRAVQRKYDDAKKEVRKSVAKLVSSLPDGECILNKDLAEMAGISPSHLAGILGRYPRNFQKTTVPVTRRFIEIDEKGNTIGAVIEKQVELLAYSAR